MVDAAAASEARLAAATRNHSASDFIHDGASRCTVQVLESQQDEQTARHACALVAA